MKKVLSIQDLSCVGKCSLTVALPVLSAMGISCSVLPTAVLSTHTGFPKPHRSSLTEHMVPMATHWETIGAEFDGVCVGYLADPRQVAAVKEILSRQKGLKVVDPVMGDHGRLYSGISPEQVEETAKLCRLGDVLVPNITEAAFLTGLPYRENADPGYYRELLEGMKSFGAGAVILTGAALSEGQIGCVGTCRESGDFTYQTGRLDKQFHGTGDLFAAVLTGGLLLGKDLPQAATLAAGFVERVIGNTPDVTPFGVDFEPELPWLWQQL